MKAFILYHLSTWFDFSIIFAIAMSCIGIYNAVMLKNAWWLVGMGISIIVAAIFHVIATWLLEDAMYYATKKQLAAWDLL